MDTYMVTCESSSDQAPSLRVPPESSCYLSVYLCTYVPIYLSSLEVYIPGWTQKSHCCDSEPHFTALALAAAANEVGLWVRRRAGMPRVLFGS